MNKTIQNIALRAKQNIYILNLHNRSCGLYLLGILDSQLFQCLRVGSHCLQQVNLVSRCLSVVVRRFLDFQRDVLLWRRTVHAKRTDDEANNQTSS